MLQRETQAKQSYGRNHMTPAALPGTARDLLSKSGRCAPGASVDFAQGRYLALAAENFLTDRKASGKTKGTVENYQLHLAHFITYFDTQSLAHAQYSPVDRLR